MKFFSKKAVDPQVIRPKTLIQVTTKLRPMKTAEQIEATMRNPA
jgi:hypothetical protein